VIIIATVLGLSIAFYLSCFLLSRKLVEDYWRWRFQHLPSWGRFDWTYWLGPCSLFAAFAFRFIHRNQEALP
jgi:hypothetical protein